MQDSADPAAPQNDPIEAATPAPQTPETTELGDVQAPPAGSGDDGSAIAEVLAVENLRDTGLELWEWILANVLTLNVLIQLVLLVVAIVPAVIFGPRLRRLIERQIKPRVPAGFLRRAVDALGTVGTMIALWITLGIFGLLVGPIESLVALLLGPDRFGPVVGGAAILSAARSLLTAAIVIRLVTLVIRSAFWSKVAFYVAWPIAALDAFGLLDNVVDQLAAASITLAPAEGDRAAVTLSMLDIVRAGIIFAIFFWIASLASSLINRQLQHVDELNPSFKALLEKVLNFVMPIIALVLALQMIGFNLASLAVFSGAVGLGIGLGLQKIISNFLAGFTLLADKSIKPGDVIQVGDVYGWITEMKSRYVSVRTRDGHSHLIPNSTFIDDGVVNWSHNDRAVRIHAPFGVTYNQRDMSLVQRLAIECAKSTDRVLDAPAPVCLMTEFGDNSVNFDLRFWINDPPSGIANVRSAVMMKLWDTLHDHDIEIPFPQRDLHIRSSDIDLSAMLSDHRDRQGDRQGDQQAGS
ncbi:hypothetical protein PB2503_04237 [Parvularcula bermudensis HTCC2503]|uniref:Mechanosensitive ion channel family protein n=1 Tax=Parvularcula bermudensis (strain ATCC BAA-594 / HTCC2503 / KCTC 12087) TaxID=314260 RepID=E0TEN9_PARBH|nr:mechanosensitive ion channel domain-containing protein [Parvularcula bermudensis]ADM08922.1 hypothetical protein PB2503_04237 [Parvularcula bermudensis HTCC2503]